jgi:hypothetical protein
MNDNPVTLTDLERALDNLLIEAFPPLEETDITIMTMKARLQSSYETAEKRLNELTAAGKLEYLGERLHKGHKVKAWRIRKVE